MRRSTMKARFAAVRVDAARADLELELGHAQNQPSTLLRAGTPPAGQEQERLFSIELVINLAYVQFSGDPISFEYFAQHHASLSRQIYPLIQSQASTVLHQLGLSMVRLPMDLSERAVSDSGTVH